MEQKARKPWVNWLIFAATVVIVFCIGLFAASIIERRTESKLYFQQPKPIAEWEPRNEVWGENFPREFESYLKTLDTTFKSEHGGSAKIDYLAKYPELVVLWAGYPFSRDYNQGRGHYHAIEDIQNTLRTTVPLPGTCWTCKSTDVPGLMNKMGVADFYHKKWSELGDKVLNPIGCQDCHEPNTMNLRITRPALIEAMERQGVDIKKVSFQDMRTLVCAQCHVEYYFKGDGKYLTFPWDKGFSADSMEAYYDNIQFSDWTHALSKTPMLKAQHPDYEIFKTGVHADRGVSCADCHMPYKRDGSMKYTDHWMQSPLNNISGSCQVCHKESEETLRRNVYERQAKIEQVRRIAEKHLATTHIEAKAAWDNGATEAEMKPILLLIRHAQWRWDWVAAANGMGFHSPIEALRLLSTSINQCLEARLLLAKVLTAHNVKQPVAIPDISTKEKAQKYIGLDMAAINKQKADFKNTTMKQWLKNAEKSKGSYSKK